MRRGRRGREAFELQYSHPFQMLIVEVKKRRKQRNKKLESPSNSFKDEISSHKRRASCINVSCRKGKVNN